MIAARYVELTPRGVLRCMSTASGDAAIPLLRALLLRDADRAWQTDELARLMPDKSASTARTLFQLQRDRCIDVRLTPPENTTSDWAGVQSDLEAMVAQGASQAALLDADGLVLAQAVRPHHADDALAPPLVACTQLVVGNATLAGVYGLALHGLPAEDSWPLVQLARRLVRVRSWH